MNIMKRAAQLRRANKRLTVQQSVKKAAAELRAKKKKVGAAVLVSRGTKVYRTRRKSNGEYNGVTRLSGVTGGDVRKRGVEYFVRKMVKLEERILNGTAAERRKDRRELAKVKRDYKKFLGLFEK